MKICHVRTHHLPVYMYRTGPAPQRIYLEQQRWRRTLFGIVHERGYSEPGRTDALKTTFLQIRMHLVSERTQRISEPELLLCVLETWAEIRPTHWRARNLLVIYASRHQPRHASSEARLDQNCPYCLQLRAYGRQGWGHWQAQQWLTARGIRWVMLS